MRFRVERMSLCLCAGVGAGLAGGTVAAAPAPVERTFAADRGGARTRPMRRKTSLCAWLSMKRLGRDTPSLALALALALLCTAALSQAITPASSVTARPVTTAGSITAQANLFAPRAVSAAGQIQARAAIFSPSAVTIGGAISAQGDFVAPPAVFPSSTQPTLRQSK